MEDNKSELRLQAYEMGLPSPEDLTPLSQSLISPQLALAFGITRPNTQAQFDLNLAMHDDDNNNINYFDSLNLRLKRGDYEETNSGSKDEYGDDNGPNRAVKRPRLVWTPKLHKRFVDVIEHLGVEKSVPKTIMEMMNVDGLTRENVASHLQKYRLYLKRMEGEGQTSLKREPSFFECEGFGGTNSLQGSQQQGVHCGSLNLMTMPVVPPPPGGGYGGGYGLNVGVGAPSGYCGLESGAYSVFWNRQRG